MKFIRIALIPAFILSALTAGAEVVNIPGTSNIFGAGHAVAPAPGGGGGGSLPPGIAIPSGTGRRLTFSSVTGLTHNEGGAPAWNADGFTFAVNLTSTEGVSGFAADKAMTLVGVFLTDAEPANPAPSSLDFRAAGLGMSFTSLSPGINQTFVIGDGRTGTGSGSVQQFLIPDSATRLFLGFADGGGFQGAPGNFADNTGSLAAGLAFTATAGTNIAPQGVGLMGANNGGLGIYNHGLLSYIRDGNPATRVTNETAAYTQPNPTGWVGVGWPAARTDSVKSVTVTIAALSDGGWFGSREIAAPGTALTAAHLRQDLPLDFNQEPIVQINRGAAPNFSGSWITVASSSDYVAAMTGLVIPATTGTAANRSFTITLRERPLGITAIRVLGPMAGSNSHGFISIAEMAVEADPVTDTDNDQMDDAWEAANGLNVGVNDANTDADGDSMVTLDEFIWRTNAQVQDTDGDGIRDGFESTYGTHPNTADTDGDGYSDGVEELSTVPGFVDTNGARRDLDFDGLSDREEINTHLTNVFVYDSDGDGFSDGQEIRLGLNPLSASSRLPNLARAGRGIMGRNTVGSLTLPGTSIGNGGDPLWFSDRSLLTFAHSGGNANNGGSGSTYSHAGILLGANLASSLTVTRIEVTFVTFGHGGWFGTSGPAPGTALTAAHLTVPELQASTDGSSWTAVPATSDYVTRLTGHVIGNSTTPTRRSAVFTLNTPTTLRAIRLVGRHRNFLAVSDISITTSLDTNDTDADGLSNADEATRGTSPTYNDTDGDGLSDFDEVTTHLTNPLVADTDGDTFADGHEIHAGTDPLGAGAPAGPLVLHPLPGLSLLGTGIMGTSVAATAGNGTSVLHTGVAANIVDENPITRVDSWNGAGTDPYSFVGVNWGTTNLQTVAMLKVRFATFVDGGWFGPNNTGPAPGCPLTAADLAEPVVQVRYNNDTTWTTVPHTSDYLAVMPGHQIGTGIGNDAYTVTTSPAATFVLSVPQSNVNAVRLIGLEGGKGQSYIGVYDFAAFAAVPPPPSADPDADNDGLPDAWEIEKFGSIAARTAAGDLDNDGWNELLEYAFNLNPAAYDAPPAAALEGDYLTMTLTKRPLVTYSILSGGTLGDFSTTDTTTLINDATTLKVRDNFPITGPAGRRFLKTSVTAVP